MPSVVIRTIWAASSTLPNTVTTLFARLSRRLAPSRCSRAVGPAAQTSDWPTGSGPMLFLEALMPLRRIPLATYTSPISTIMRFASSHYLLFKYQRWREAAPQATRTAPEQTPPSAILPASHAMARATCGWRTSITISCAQLRQCLAAPSLRLPEAAVLAAMPPAAPTVSAVQRPFYSPSTWL